MKKSVNTKLILAAVVSAVVLAAAGCDANADVNLNVTNDKKTGSDAAVDVTDAAEAVEDEASETEPAETEAAEEDTKEEVTEPAEKAEKEEVTEEKEEEKTEESSENSWIAAYQAEIDRYADENGAMYELADINGDNIPELFISGGEFHAAGVEVFTVANGKVVNLGEMGSFGEVMYDPDHKAVREGYSGQGYTMGSIFTVENGSMNVLVKYDSADLEDERWFKIDDAEVTEEEYNSAVEKYSTDVRLGRKNDINAKVADVYNG